MAYEYNTHHADEETGLLGRAAYTSITDDTDGKASCETCKADGETGAELNEALVKRHLRGHYAKGGRQHGVTGATGDEAYGCRR